MKLKYVYVIQYDGNVISQEGYSDIQDAFDRLDRQGYKAIPEEYNNWTRVDKNGSIAKIFAINVK